MGLLLVEFRWEMAVMKESFCRRAKSKNGALLSPKRLERALAPFPACGDGPRIDSSLTVYN